MVFDDKALAATFNHYRSTVALRDTALAAVEADLAGYFTVDPFADAVTRLGAYRGVTHMGALCLGAEVFDWRRFPNARSFMSFTGLTCSEKSTGLSERRGAICEWNNCDLDSRTASLRLSDPPRSGASPTKMPSTTVTAAATRVAASTHPTAKPKTKPEKP